MKKILSIAIAALVAASSFAAEAPTKKGTTKSKAKAKTEASKPAADDKPSAKATAAAATLTSSQKTKLMGILNEGDEKSLMSLPRIGEVKAAAIKKARPIKDPLDLLKVDGIGDETFGEIVAHAKAGFPEAATPEKPKAKAPSTKKGTTKKDSTKK
ncbi:MAG: helix-hairpin-helix domain-containing protein [Verrucomicrobiales bacterium]|nr:helix-hairpin-helix domain-containing protein [Verrucomicrobiales bacterium]